MAAIKIEPKGFQDFEIQGCLFSVDIFRAYNGLVMINSQYKDDFGGEVKHIVALIKDLGGPECSQAEAVEFNNHVIRLAQEIGDFFGGKSSSPPNTASPAST